MLDWIYQNRVITISTIITIMNLNLLFHVHASHLINLEGNSQCSFAIGFENAFAGNFYLQPGVPFLSYWEGVHSTVPLFKFSQQIRHNFLQSVSRNCSTHIITDYIITLNPVYIFLANDFNLFPFPSSSYFSVYVCIFDLDSIVCTTNIWTFGTAYVPLFYYFIVNHSFLLFRW